MELETQRLEGNSGRLRSKAKAKPPKPKLSSPEAEFDELGPRTLKPNPKP